MFVRDRGPDTCNFLDGYWSKSVEKIGLLNRKFWRCVIDLENTDELLDYQVTFAEYLFHAGKNLKADIDIGVHLPVGYNNKSLYLLPVLIEALNETGSSIKFSLYECEEEQGKC